MTRQAMNLELNHDNYLKHYAWVVLSGFVFNFNDPASGSICIGNNVINRRELTHGSDCVNDDIMLEGEKMSEKLYNLMRLDWN
jgi:hypothetical protein